MHPVPVGETGGCKGQGQPGRRGITRPAQANEGSAEGWGTRPGWPTVREASPLPVAGGQRPQAGHGLKAAQAARLRRGLEAVALGKGGLGLSRSPATRRGPRAAAASLQNARGIVTGRPGRQARGRRPRARSLVRSTKGRASASLGISGMCTRQPRRCPVRHTCLCHLHRHPRAGWHHLRGAREGGRGLSTLFVSPCRGRAITVNTEICVCGLLEKMPGDTLSRRPSDRDGALGRSASRCHRPLVMTFRRARCASTVAWRALAVFLSTERTR